MNYNKYLVSPDENIKIKDYDPNDSSEFEGKKKKVVKPLKK